MNTQSQRQAVIYQYKMRPFSLARSAQQWYQRDLKRRTKQGWRLVSCTQTGSDRLRKQTLTAIYER